jgi:hypothetical protein
MKVNSRSTFFISYQPFSSSKYKLVKISHTFIELVVTLIFNHLEHLLRVLADTGACSSSILEGYTSVSFIKTDESNTINWIEKGLNLLQLKLGYVCGLFTPRFQSLRYFMLVTVLSHQVYMI